LSLMGLFIVVDLFTNLDDFTQHRQGLATTLRYIRIYYTSVSPRIFDRLCEAIVLLSAMFTVALMQRHNELLPLLSAGVSTRRVVTPVLIAASAMLGLSILNQELLMPSIDSYFIEFRGNIEGDKDIEVKGIYDIRGVHISGKVARKNTLTVEKFFCMIPPRQNGDNLVTLQAESAVYVPPEDDEPHSGGWMLTRTTPPELDNWRRTDILENLGTGKYFLHTDVDFDAAIRPKNWAFYMSTWRVLEEMNRPGNQQQAGLAVIFHTRLTRPLLGLTLVVMGLGVILRDQNRNVFISAGLCLVICAAFFAACFSCQQLGDKEFLSPALAAWLPVMLFGPMAFVMFDAIHT